MSAPKQKKRKKCVMIELHHPDNVGLAYVTRQKIGKTIKPMKKYSKKLRMHVLHSPKKIPKAT